MLLCALRPVRYRRSVHDFPQATDCVPYKTTLTTAGWLWGLQFDNRDKSKSTVRSGSSLQTVLLAIATQLSGPSRNKRAQVSVQLVLNTKFC